MNLIKKRTKTVAPVTVVALILCTLCLNGNRSAAAHDEFPPVEHCSIEQGGGVCPVANTCCRSHYHSSSLVSTTASTCIPSDLGARVATCCEDGMSGCGIDYRCGEVPIGAVNNDDMNGLQSKKNIKHGLSSLACCLATEQIQDPLVQVLPRYYPLCQLLKHSNFSEVFGFSSPRWATVGCHELQMPYYSSHGDIGKYDREQEVQQIQMVIFVIHGANRNADDYFCSITSALRRQTKLTVEQVLVIAPRFLVPSDPAPSHYLRWRDTPNGPWRYGANAVQPTAARNISSFDVLDAMIDQIKNKLNHLQYITVVGHSSGGQFVQRWALLSPAMLPSAAAAPAATMPALTGTSLNMRAVVANPSSYAYLTPLRYNRTQQTWAVPDYQACPEYNIWEWGLDQNDSTPPYVTRVLKAFSNDNVSNQKAHPYEKLLQRFAQRKIIYLQGSLDRCNVSSPSSATLPHYSSYHQKEPWCYSHGLETTCMDQLQGTNRLERNIWYMKMLHHVGVIGTDCEHKHRKMKSNNNNTCKQEQIIVPFVGHDHALIFSSLEGLQSIFHYEDENEISYL